MAVLGAGILALGCRTEPRAAIVVEADTTRMVSGSARPVVEPARTAQAPEVVVIEEAAPPSESVASDPPEELAGSEPSDPRDAGDPREVGTPRPEPDPRRESDLLRADEPAAARAATYVPAGTRLALELRTPLHSGTTRVGDRFAVRTVEPVMVGEAVAIEPGALVEGRIAGVVRSGEAGDPGQIELDFRDLVLPDGRRLPLEAEIASVAGREAEVAPRPGPVAVAGSAAGGAVLGGSIGGRRGAMIGAAIGAVGAALVASARDHEVVVPSGTRMEITLTTPLEIPGR